jgi:hypothetical protein
MPPIAAEERIVGAKRAGVLLLRAAAIEDLGRVEVTQKAWAETTAEASTAARSADRMVIRCFLFLAALRRNAGGVGGASVSSSLRPREIGGRL